jgi:hypothetical protein
MCMFRQGRPDTYQARMDRTRDDAYSRGFHEAGLFKLALGQDFQRRQALDWLDTVIDQGRAELEDQHAREREVEAWDMSCRIAFMVALRAAPRPVNQ